MASTILGGACEIASRRYSLGAKSLARRTANIIGNPFNCFPQSKTKNMPISHSIWKVGYPPQVLSTALLFSEQQLEDMIVAAPEILSGEWMLIGRQEQTGLGGRIDLLAIAPDASLVLIELKRNKTPREIVAQAIDYASWVEQLTPEKIVQIYDRFSNGRSLSERNRFGVLT